MSAASGRGGAGDRPRTEEPRGFAGHGHQRSAHAGHAGERSARQIARGVSAGAARSAHGLFGHRSGRQSHQRGASRSLSVEAVGSARGTPLPGDRRSARRLAGRVSARGEGTAAGRAPVVAPIARDQGLPGEQSHSVSLARRRAGPGRARAAGCGRSGRGRASGAVLRRRTPCCATRSRRRWPSASADRSRPPSMCTTS